MFLILDQVLTNLILTPLSVSFLIIPGLRRDINGTLQMLMLPLLSLSHISLALVLPKKIDLSLLHLLPIFWFWVSYLITYFYT